MEDTIWFVLKFIICPFTATVLAGLVVVYHKRIPKWVGILLSKLKAFLMVIMFSPFRKGLGIQKLDEKLTEIEETALYTITKQIEMNERVTKLEEVMQNPHIPSSENDNDESGEIKHDSF